MQRALAALLATLVIVAGCGAAEEPEPAPAANAWPAAELTPEPGFDLDDPALQTIPDDKESADKLIRRAGTRRDFKVPRDMLDGLEDGPLVRAVALRPFYEIIDPAGARRLNDGQRAVYSIYLADFEILNGGFAQLWENSSGSVAADLVAAAERIGSPELAAIFRAAAALWPGGRIPRDRDRREQLLYGIDDGALADLDLRYAALQYRRKTALAVVLAPYIRAHLDEFAYRPRA